MDRIDSQRGRYGQTERARTRDLSRDPVRRNLNDRQTRDDRQTWDDRQPSPSVEEVNARLEAFFAEWPKTRREGRLHVKA